MPAILLNKPVHLRVVEDVFVPAIDLRARDEAAQELLSRVASYVQTLNDDYLNIEPWFIFHAWLDYRFEPFAKCHNIFRAWQLFHWTPDPSTVKDPVFGDAVRTIVAAFTKSNQGRLNADELEILKRASQEQLDLYEVVAVKETQIILFGLISRRKIHVYHPTLGGHTTPGEFLLASAIVAQDDTYILLGVSDPLPKEAAPDVNEFCDFIDRCDPSTPRTFKSFESDVFNLFYDLTQDV